jgi:hypothetical protein
MARGKSTAYPLDRTLGPSLWRQAAQGVHQPIGGSVKQQPELVGARLGAGGAGEHRRNNNFPSPACPLTEISGATEFGPHAEATGGRPPRDQFHRSGGAA